VAENPPASNDDATPEAVKTPTSARVAVLVMWVLAGLLLLNVALTVVALDSLVDQTTASRGVTRDEAQRAYLIGIIPAAVFGLLIGLSAWGLARRHAWARWVGLGAALMLFALTLLTALAGAFNVFSLLLLVLAMVVCGSLLARTTADWIPRLRRGS
jgi:hypothetical protein